jgi:hypothetical protein
MERKCFIIDSQQDLFDYLKYIQDKSFEGFSFKIECHPIKGKNGKITGEFIIETYRKEGWKYIIN